MMIYHGAARNGLPLAAAVTKKHLQPARRRGPTRRTLGTPALGSEPALVLNRARTTDKNTPTKRYFALTHTRPRTRRVPGGTRICDEALFFKSAVMRAIILARACLAREPAHEGRLLGGHAIIRGRSPPTIRVIDRRDPRVPPGMPPHRWHHQGCGGYGRDILAWALSPSDSFSCVWLYGTRIPT